MRFKIDPNITTTLLVGATIIGVTQTTIYAASAATDARFERIDARLERIDARFERIDARFEKMDARIHERFERMDARIDARFERMDARIDARFQKTDARIDDVAAGIARVEGLIQGFHAASPAEDAAVSEEPG